jgi:predicted RNA binding protein YcfA (HicA-like mRNA interferase family)
LPKLPILSGQEVVKKLRKAGFEVVREGNHVILRKGETVLPVPRYDEIDRSLLRRIIAQAGLSRQEFLAL